jgi:hypothetical protein
MSRDDPSDTPRRGERRPKSRGKKAGRWRLFLFLCCGAGLVFGLVVLGCVGYVLLDMESNSDPVQTREELARMADLEVPAGLPPSGTTGSKRTGSKSVSFGNYGITGSFLRLSTGPRTELKYMGTLQDSHDRGVVAGGGTPERPGDTKAVPKTIRGQGAEFTIRRYKRFEIVSGYFQGKQYPVTLEGRFEYQTFPAGTADKVVQSIAEQ